jgi:predicted permease
MFYSILGVYSFILIGFGLKHWFKDQIQERTFVLLSVYFMQPILVFWGLSTKPIDSTSMMVPVWFLAGIFIALLLSSVIAHFFFDDPKTRSVLTASAIIGNTGNLGIPICIAIFGKESIVYTSLIVLANTLILQTLGVYLYSRGEHSIKDSFKNILKLPVIWVAFFALMCNLLKFEIEPNIFRALEMGAHSALTLQLITFGIFIHHVKLKNLDLKLLLHVNFLKFILLPAIFFPLVLSLNLPPLIAGVLLLELSVPMAINNVNYASLYYCKPVEVTSLVLVTTLVFTIYLWVLVWLFKTVSILA